MKILRVLYTSDAVRKTVIEMFRTATGRRVAISAFVGNGAEAYLPRPEGIELICWPKEGGTNPTMVRRLLKRGVKVEFADNLHMKLYWTADKGAVITSANLSTNALGSGNLRECGVLLRSSDLDIGKVLRSIQRRDVTRKELLELDREYKDYHKRNKGAAATLERPFVSRVVSFTVQTGMEHRVLGCDRA